MKTDTARLRALYEAATPGPWYVPRGKGCRKIRGPKKPGRQSQGSDIGYTVGLADDRLDAANAMLIAETHNALPALLDEVDALRAVAEAAKATGPEGHWHRARCAASGVAPHPECDCEKRRFDALADALRRLDEVRRG